jgi:hypothetical protein
MKPPEPPCDGWFYRLWRIIKELHRLHELPRPADHTGNPRRKVSKWHAAGGVVIARIVAGFLVPQREDGPYQPLKPLAHGSVNFNFIYEQYMDRDYIYCHDKWDRFTLWWSMLPMLTKLPHTAHVEMLISGVWLMSKTTLKNLDLDIDAAGALQINPCDFRKLMQLLCHPDKVHMVRIFCSIILYFYVYSILFYYYTTIY